MSAGTYDLVLQQGIEHDLIIASWRGPDGRPYDITGYSASMVMQADPSGPCIARFSTADGTIAAEGEGWCVPMSAEFTARLRPLPWRLAYTACGGAIAYEAGEYFFNATSAGGETYPVLSGSVLIVLGVCCGM